MLPWPVEFDLAHVPEEVSECYSGADQELLRACRLLVLAMVAAWRWDLDDQLPGRRFHLLPVSALKGDNVVEPSPRMPWYGGMTLLELLETIEQTLVVRADIPFRLEHFVEKAVDGVIGKSSPGVLHPLLRLIAWHDRDALHRDASRVART